MDSSSSRSLAQGIFVLVVITIFTCVGAGSDADARNRTILVGDSQGWEAGTNYTEWASQNSPFHVNDTLVFKHGGNSTLGQSVYLLSDLWSYITCEFKGAKLLGNATGEGFKVQLNQLRSYYFASSEGNAYDCIAGLTKFIANPSTPS